MLYKNIPLCNEIINITLKIFIIYQTVINLLKGADPFLNNRKKGTFWAKSIVHSLQVVCQRNLNNWDLLSTPEFS